ncbi:carboxypeptidase-like regulatory domain-containing protein [Catellatospora sp. KI3]|uniref:carboxypeptidase-like regulatory domain-containing protein n=1 Tax=Catellatospora sp. KI3 TaxID=3041620 RepID=UPI002482DE8E|nr:carboxypeptidase-like regulatory domain-containing protein [Catellatospora sp. KI3]MDI1462928.1 carboxypeptidase-like regulatory domain-containing protein [Catellatospora sp. KI3]
MFTTTRRRAGILALAAALGALGLAAPAQAEETGTITGTLTDAGRPVAGAAVSAYGPGWGSATTDATGHYELSGLAAGAYRVQFDAPGHPSQYAYQQTEWSNAAEVSVPGGGQVTVDDQLLPTGTITGTFTDQAGDPVASVPVYAESDLGTGAAATTGSDGAYTLAVLPGSYRIAFESVPGNRQYAVGTADQGSATVYPVAAGQNVVVDDTALPTGRVAGRFTERDGTGIADVQVQVYSSFGPNFVTTTDHNGEFHLDQVFAGVYRVRFDHYERNFFQFYPGKLEDQYADAITVTAGQTTTTDDTLLPTGSVHFTVTDALTGAPIAAFGAGTWFTSVEGTGGSLTIDGVSVGNQRVYASAAGYLSSGEVRVTVTEGVVAEVAIALTPTAKIAATVVDARTGAPVEGFCVLATKQDETMFLDRCTRSDSDGHVLVDYLRAGSYQLFAYGNLYEEQRSPYGAQWVTADGGTGNQSLAAWVTVTAGQTTTGPVIKLDRRGTITGTIKGVGGAAVTSSAVTFGNFHYHSGDGPITIAANADGAYTVDFLGPYHWPLRFVARDYPTQWSGNAPTRPSAAKIKVWADRSVTYDIQLVQGATLTVDGPERGWYVAYNASNGETVGACNTITAHSCQMRVLGPQNARFKVWGDQDWWYGGTDITDATPVKIPATGTKTVTITH